jgi:hypothetical protein
VNWQLPIANQKVEWIKLKNSKHKTANTKLITPNSYLCNLL